LRGDISDLSTLENIIVSAVPNYSSNRKFFPLRPEEQSSPKFRTEKALGIFSPEEVDLQLLTKNLSDLREAANLFQSHYSLQMDRGAILDCLNLSNYQRDLLLKPTAREHFSALYSSIGPEILETKPRDLVSLIFG